MQKNTLNQGHYAIPWPVKKFPAFYGKRINTKTKGRRMIQADTHKDANKRKKDTTRQTGTCGKKENVCTTASCAAPLFSYVTDVNTGSRRMQNARCLPAGATRDDQVLQPGAICREYKTRGNGMQGPLVSSGRVLLLRSS
jgi:hypothetical protein